jgi:hypothetical protein
MRYPYPYSPMTRRVRLNGLGDLATVVHRNWWVAAILLGIVAYKVYK